MGGRGGGGVHAAHFSGEAHMSGGGLVLFTGDSSYFAIIISHLNFKVTNRLF